MIGVDVKGADELQRKLNELAYAGASRASRKGVMAGLKIVEEAQRAAAPVYRGPPRKNSKGQAIRPGALKASINSRFKRGTGRNKGWISAKSGLNVGGRNAARERFMAETQEQGFGQVRAYHAHLVALGTNPRWAGIKYGYDQATVYGRRKKRGTGRIKLRGAKTYNEAKNTFTGKRISYRGVMPANDFIARATASVEGPAVQATRDVILQQIEREAAKLK